MILTNCPACAAPLAHDAPRCVRCKLRYDSERMYRAVDEVSEALYHNRNVAQNKFFLELWLSAAIEKLGPHLVTFKLRYNYANTIYMYHFFGYDEYEDDYHTSLLMLDELEQDLMSYSSRDMLGRGGKLLRKTRELRAYALNHRLE